MCWEGSLPARRVRVLEHPVLRCSRMTGARVAQVQRGVHGTAGTAGFTGKNRTKATAGSKDQVASDERTRARTIHTITTIKLPIRTAAMQLRI